MKTNQLALQFLLLISFTCSAFATKVYTISALPEGYTEAEYILELEEGGFKFRNGKSLETTYSLSALSSSEELKIVLTDTDVYLLSPADYVLYRAGTIPSTSFAKMVKNLKIGLKLTTTGVTTATLVEGYEKVYIHTVGNKQYECTDHLGNVAAVVTDQKLASTTKLKYNANLLSATEYYPFGSPMPERSYSSPSYRYGFNGMEKDDEVKGSSGTSYDFGARVYDSRLGRWLAIDPLSYKYPGDNPYSFGANNPLYFIDKGGRFLVDKNGNVVVVVISATEHLTEFGKEVTQEVYIFTNEGMAVKAEVTTVFDKEGKPESSLISYNCHGSAVFKSYLVIDSGNDGETDMSKVPSNVLIADAVGECESGANLVKEGKKEFKNIKGGDIVVFFDKDGKAIHSARFKETDKAIEALKKGEVLLNSKNGIGKHKEDQSLKSLKNLYSASKEKKGGSVEYFTPTEPVELKEAEGKVLDGKGKTSEGRGLAEFDSIDQVQGLLRKQQAQEVIIVK